MGRGDKKSKKGKRWKGSFGNSRRRNAIKARIKRATTVAKPIAEKSAEEAKPKAKRVVKKKETTVE